MVSGGTNFLMVKPKRGEGEGDGDKECGIMDCDAEYEKGLTCRTAERNAVFWMNVGEDGRGDERVLHRWLGFMKGETLT